MARLANISGKEAVKIFKKFGWESVGQVGSHVVMIKEGMKVNLSIPQLKSYQLEPACINLKLRYECRRIS